MPRQIVLDAKDRRIVRELQLDGRLTNQELAERVNLSPSPCLRRVRNLERMGIIEGYTALIDQRAYGLPITVFMRVRLERHARDAVGAFEDSIRRFDEILECYLMTGNSDYLLRVVVESLEAYEAFVRTRLHGIRGIASIDTSFAYGVVKRTRAYPPVD
jgi:DNA-binding Lrp family transcriptional regulator